MDERQATQEARRRWGRGSSVSKPGGCVYVYDGNMFAGPRGFGSSYEEAFIDADRNDEEREAFPI